MKNIKLTDSVEVLPGVGKVVVTRLKRLQINTIEDLLWHAPSSYEDYRVIVKVATAPTKTPLTLKGRLTNVEHRRSWRHRQLQLTESIFSDESGSIEVVWFGRFPRKNLPIGEDIYLWGNIEIRSDHRQMVNPEWTLAKVSPPPGLEARYPLTDGLTQWHLRRFIGVALEGIYINDYFDKQFIKSHQLIDIKQALQKIHKPVDEKSIIEARRRLAFDELFFLQLSRNILRRRRGESSAMPLPMRLEDITALLPLTLTQDQKIAAQEILKDLNKSTPMNRLLEGDVGTGKTVVAAIAAIAAAHNDCQSLYLAPTTVLAEQQYENFKSLCAPFSIKAALLTSARAETSNGLKSRRAILAVLKKREIDIVIGTHTLIEKPVMFAKLALVVVDEQHRFGVKQRLAAKEKGVKLEPHILAMTATPIPRTLELSFLGDIDVSQLRIFPHGQRKVKTILFGAADRLRVEEAIRRRIAKGEGVFIICPLIDPSDKLGVKSATAEFERLRKEAFAQIPMGLLHGKLKPAEKETVLNDFRSGRLKMLVATSVVEVGIDVPEATIMVIEDAERFGLAQLHQLRGRVGRRGAEGVCVLFTSAPSAEARKRLEIFTKIQDGFALAEADLKLRGPGEWFGVKQSGFEELKFADLQDIKLTTEVHAAVVDILNKDPWLVAASLIAEKVEKLTKLSGAS